MRTAQGVVYMVLYDSLVLPACLAFSRIDFTSWFELVQVGCSVLSLSGITQHTEGTTVQIDDASISNNIVCHSRSSPQPTSCTLSTKPNHNANLQACSEVDHTVEHPYRNFRK